MNIHQSSAGGAESVTFKPKTALLRAKLTALLLTLGVLFCGPLVLLKVKPSLWLSYVALWLIYLVLVGLGLNYYRKHPRVRSRYTISDVQLGFHEFVGHAAVERTSDWFVAHTEMVKVELTPEARIAVHTVAGECLKTTWQVARGEEFVELAERYSGLV
jgi:hypothetical protein